MKIYNVKGHIFRLRWHRSLFFLQQQELKSLLNDIYFNKISQDLLENKDGDSYIKRQQTLIGFKIYF